MSINKNARLTLTLFKAVTSIVMHIYENKSRQVYVCINDEANIFMLARNVVSSDCISIFFKYLQMYRSTYMSDSRMTYF